MTAPPRTRRLRLALPSPFKRAGSPGATSGEVGAKPSPSAGSIQTPPPKAPKAKKIPRRERPKPVRAPRRPENYIPGLALLVLAGLCGGLLLHIGLVSQLRHDREQSLAYEQLRYDFAWATTTVAQYDYNMVLNEPGTPLALLEIPSLAVREVVLESTTSEILQSGPGHRRDTVLPGQSGTSVIMGRQATYGGPFGEIHNLQVGAQIVVTTGQGQNIFLVTGVRRAGDPQPPPLQGNEARLTLVTGDGPIYLPTGVLRVDAELATAVQPTPAKALRGKDLEATENAMAGDPSAWFPLVLWLQALILVVGLVTWARLSWGKHQAWIVGLPLITVLGVTVANYVSMLLPNLL